MWHDLYGLLWMITMIPYLLLWNTNTPGLISSLDFSYECNKFGILGLE